MRLLDALKIIQNPVEDRRLFSVHLVCGFEPLHLRTFLQAYLKLSLPGSAVEIRCGRYGDLIGNLQRALEDEAGGVALTIEWADLDPRLGVRQLGGWSPSMETQIVEESAQRLDQIAQVLTGGAGTPVVCSMPTLPLPPFAHTPPWIESSAEASLRQALNSFTSSMQGRVRFLHSRWLDHLSPIASRRSVSSELNAGFPYTLPHADALASLLAKLLLPHAPKKALITDLDNCLWNGSVGEVGCENVHWDLDHRCQIHGLYQQMLASLAEAGVLVGVASRNDPAQVEAALRRADLLVGREHLFPVEAHWRSKSESVARILRRWNIAPESVVFVDDSAMELAEVRMAYPEIECLLFPSSDPDAGFKLLYRLRELFGKTQILEEDRIRSRSLRAASLLPAEGGTNGRGAPTEFLQRCEGVLTFVPLTSPSEPRALELINKTNQFNLNGRRYSEAEWSRDLAHPSHRSWVVSYTDRFGPLGKIAVLSGWLQGGDLKLDIWVMSCRAFGRQIEHESLKYLFDHAAIEAVAFDYAPTPRNAPLGEWLKLYVGDLFEGPVHITREMFLSRCPPLFHRIRGFESETQTWER